MGPSGTDAGRRRRRPGARWTRRGGGRASARARAPRAPPRPPQRSLPRRRRRPARRARRRAAPNSGVARAQALRARRRRRRPGPESLRKAERAAPARLAVSSPLARAAPERSQLPVQNVANRLLHYMHLNSGCCLPPSVTAGCSAQWPDSSARLTAGQAMCPDAASGQGAPEPQQQPGAAANGGGLGARPDAELGGAEMRNGAAEPPGAWLCVGAALGSVEGGPGCVRCY
jgi:hypothetical protein